MCNDCCPANHGGGLPPFKTSGLEPVKIADADPSRKSLTLENVSGTGVVGWITNAGAGRPGVGKRLVVGEVVTIEHTGEVWACDEGDPCTFSLYVESRRPTGAA